MLGPLFCVVVHCNLLVVRARMRVFFFKSRFVKCIMGQGIAKFEVSFECVLSVL